MIPNILIILAFGLAVFSLIWPGRTFARIAILLISIALLVGTARGGTDVVLPTPSPAPPDINPVRFAEAVANAGNFSIAVSPGYAPKLGNGEWGLAILGGYQINQYAGAYLRADLFDGNYTVASGSLTAQYPIKFGKLVVRPFVEAGIGSTLGGAGDKNKDVFAIAGGGVAVDLWHSKDIRQSLSVFYALETWEPVYHGISIHRGGLRYGLTF